MADISFDDLLFIGSIKKVTLVIRGIYDELISLDNTDVVNTKYSGFLDKLREAKIIEDRIYSNINIADIQKYIEYIQSDKTIVNSSIVKRITVRLTSLASYSSLQYRYRYIARYIKEIKDYYIEKDPYSYINSNQDKEAECSIIRNLVKDDYLLRLIINTKNKDIKYDASFLSNDIENIMLDNNFKINDNLNEYNLFDKLDFDKVDIDASRDAVLYNDATTMISRIFNGDKDELTKIKLITLLSCLSDETLDIIKELIIDSLIKHPSKEVELRSIIDYMNNIKIKNKTKFLKNEN